MLPIILSVKIKNEYVASITGSAFSLKDVNNNAITEKSFEGQSLSFWVYELPDVCPMTLNKLDYISNKLGKEKKVEIFLLVLIRKEILEVMKDYLSSFDNKIIGITGESEKYFSFQNRGVLKVKRYSLKMEAMIDHSSPIILLRMVNTLVVLPIMMILKSL